MKKFLCFLALLALPLQAQAATIMVNDNIINLFELTGTSYVPTELRPDLGAYNNQFSILYGSGAMFSDGITASTITTTDLTVTGVFTFGGVMGSDLDMQGNNILHIGHLTGSGSYLAVGTGSASWPAVSGENDAYVTEELEVDGILYMDGTALLRGDTGSTGGAQLYFNEASTLASSLRADFGRDQLLWTSGSALGKQLILTDHDNRARDHDRPEGSNPWFYVFSSTNVDTVSNEWIGISFDPTIPGAVIDTGSGTVRIDAAFSLKVSATTSLVDDDTIDCNDDAVMRITGSGASVLLDTDPAIADGLTDGQLCEIEAASDTNLVTIADNVNTELDNGLQFIMGQGDQLVFRWNADDGTWYEKSRSDN